MSDTEETRSLSASPSPNETEAARCSSTDSHDDKAKLELLKLCLGHLGSEEAARALPVYPHKFREERKRRRVLGNSDNTLDGLVAKRADAEPFMKRYQTESEAIELPDDELEMKRLETDPDVSTRMCSICGYQGKWVSEMIRHKRVHTNERPFKCKHCNRTSKWKADLIRHVAKTHGIRVVSRYSRSKTFDAQTDLKEEMLPKEENGKQRKFSPPTPVPSVTESAASTASGSSSTPAFRCLVCFLEQDSIDALVTHLHTAHNAAPFECLQCKRTFEEVTAATGHCAPAACTPLSIKINFSPIYSQKSSHSIASTATTSSPCSVRSDSDGTASALSNRTDDDEVSSVSGTALVCPECPFRADSHTKLEHHKTGHETPKGLLNYKCVFCTWYSKKKGSIEKHMALHTNRPEEFMSQVERNLITPAALLESAAKAQQHGLALSLPSTPLSATAAAAPLLGGFGLFGTPAPAPNSLDLASSLLSQALYPSLSTPTTPSLMDLSALQSLSSNPLLAYSLCSLLEKNANLLKFEHVA